MIILSCQLQFADQDAFIRNDFVKEFGVNVSVDMTTIDARVLPPPAVIFFFFPSDFMFNMILSLFWQFLTLYSLFWLLQLRYHDSGRAKTIRPQTGQWNAQHAVNNISICSFWTEI